MSKNIWVGLMYRNEQGRLREIPYSAGYARQCFAAIEQDCWSESYTNATTVSFPAANQDVVVSYMLLAISETGAPIHIHKLSEPRALKPGDSIYMPAGSVTIPDVVAITLMIDPSEPDETEAENVMLQDAARTFAGCFKKVRGRRGRRRAQRARRGT